MSQTSSSTGIPISELPDCYEGPKMVESDSSSVDMCDYKEDMVQINEMNSDPQTVTLGIKNVWFSGDVPSSIKVYPHNTNVGEAFQCSETEGSTIERTIEFSVDNDDEIIDVDVECYQKADGDPWLAVIDVVITDAIICGSNQVDHPCIADVAIMESCSWRMVVPCESKAMCTEEPTSNPTASPTVSPTVSPTITTRKDTVEPTAELEPLGTDDDTDDIFFPPVGPEDCPDDILLVSHTGVTNYPKDTVRIVSRDGSTVTVELWQTYTGSDKFIDNIYYQYQHNHFSNVCLAEENVYGNNSSDEISIEKITIECTSNSQVALLELWFADNIEKDVLSEGDNAIIPDCCHPTVAEDTPVTKYVVEIRCVTECPEVVA